jgi:hypothetical protein
MDVHNVFLLPILALARSSNQEKTARRGSESERLRSSGAETDRRIVSHELEEIRRNFKIPKWELELCLS